MNVFANPAMQRSVYALGVLCLLSLALMGTASAQVDVTAATTALTDATTGITSVAGGMISVVGAGMAVKWILGFLIS